MKRSKGDRIVGIILAWIFGWTGAYRFYRGEPLYGLLWLLTFGVCGLGWILDMIVCFFE